MGTSKTILILFTILASAGLTGCGNDRSNPNLASQNAIAANALTTQTIGSNGSISSETTSSGSFVAATGFSCPASANVTPHYDWSLDGSDYFTACAPDNSALMQVQVGGTLTQGNQLCVFPAELTSTGKIYSQPGSDTLAMYSCGNVGQVFTFANTVFNAVFVVEPTDVKSMQVCLTSGIAADCPRAYSYGKFR